MNEEIREIFERKVMVRNTREVLRIMIIPILVNLDERLEKIEEIIKRGKINE